MKVHIKKLIKITSNQSFLKIKRGLADFLRMVKEDVCQDLDPADMITQWFLKTKGRFVFIKKHVLTNLTVFSIILKDRVRVYGSKRRIKLPKYAGILSKEELV